MIAAGAVGAVAAGLALLAQRPPRAGVRPIIWDKETCAECRMSISDRRFAAQLVAADGRIYDFDDPGCLMTFLDEHPGVAMAQSYFHPISGDTWIAASAAGFVPVGATPMAYNLGAVPATTPGALDFATARARLRALRSRRQLDRGANP